MKVSAFAQQLEKYLPGLCCPKCSQPFSLTDSQLRCGSGHCYDLSSKGYVNLAPSHDQNREKYDAALFDSRSRIFEGGFYLPVLNTLRDCLTDFFPTGAFQAADVGCGEGYYTRQLTELFPKSICYGIDLSRDGIQRAAKHRNACWLVADLKHLPLGEKSMDVLLDVLTPADYAVFRRVLKPEGVLIKVIPGNDYLYEIRGLVKDRLRNQDYDNGRVLEHLSSQGEILRHIPLRSTVPLSPAQSDDFLRMTPMTFSLAENELTGLKLHEITIHMELLAVRLYKEGAAV